MTPTTTVNANAAATADDLLERLFGTEEGRLDPYPLYRELAAVAPVHRSGRDGVWYVSGYGDCQRLLRDPHCGRKPAGEHAPRVFFVEGDRAFRFTERMRESMLWTNPPEHSRLRAPANPAFSPPRMEALRTRITEVVDACLDDMLAGEVVDAVEALALAVPVTVIGDLLGVPEEDRLHFRGMADDPLTTDSSDGTDSAVRHYLADLLAQRRRTPRGDLLSLLAAAPTLSGAERVSTAAVLFWAGYVTTANLIGNGLAALVVRPAEQARLRADPGLATSAVEEFLRFDSPIQLNGRHVLAPIEVDGQRIEAGQSLMLLVGGANRDPARFTDPDRLDLGRTGNGPLSFGLGVHHCLGAPLARLEAQIVFARLAERRLVVEPAGVPVRAPGTFVRGYASLPVRVRTATKS